jgi:D-xylose transport system permease protein
MTAVETGAGSTAPVTESGGLGAHAKAYIDKLRGGDLGALPALSGLILLILIFGITQPDFFSKINIANLFQQGAAIIVIAMGLVFVLLLGDIDLSAGYAAGLCATIFTVLLTTHHVVWWVCILTAIGVGIAIGLFNGIMVEKVGIPSFVVTLAMFLALQGLALYFLGGGRNISIFDKKMIALDNNSMPPWLGWLFFVLVVAGFAGLQVYRRIKRLGRGLPADPWSVILARVGTIVVLGGLIVAFLNAERSQNPALISLKGIPIIVPVVAALALFWTFILSRTRYGRHLYALGGNREAARRAGIRVDRIRISAFVICSAMAAVGGIILVSRSRGVYPDIGGSTILLYSVGAAVIGGTSLLGGKGRVLDAVIGGLLIAVIDNGMALAGYQSSTKFVVTAGVLLLAATVDALSRRRAAASGR